MARPGRKRNDASGGTDTREALITATIATLVESGFSGTSARSVATRAKVAAGGVFYHFGTMDDLLAAVYDRLQGARMERLAAALVRPAHDIPGALAAATRGEYERSDSRALLEIVVGAMGSPVLAARVGDGIDASVEFTANALRAVVADVPGGSALPIELVAELAASAFFGLEVLNQVGRRPDLDALARVVSLVTSMIAPPGAGRSVS